MESERIKSFGPRAEAVRGPQEIEMMQKREERKAAAEEKATETGRPSVYVEKTPLPGLPPEVKKTMTVNPTTESHDPVVTFPPLEPKKGLWNRFFGKKDKNQPRI